MRISRITGGSAAIGGERAPPIGLSVRRIGVSTVRVRRILWRARLFAYGMQSPIVGRWRWRRWRRLWEGRGRRGVGGGRAGDVSPSTPSRYLLVLNPSAGQANKGRGAVRVDVSPADRHLSLQCKRNGPSIPSSPSFRRPSTPLQQCPRLLIIR